MSFFVQSLTVSLLVSAAMVKYFETRSKLALQRETDPARQAVLAGHLERQTHGAALLPLAAAAVAALGWILQQSA